MGAYLGGTLKYPCAPLLSYLALLARPTRSITTSHQPTTRDGAITTHGKSDHSRGGARGGAERRTWVKREGGHVSKHVYEEYDAGPTSALSLSIPLIRAAPRAALGLLAELKKQRRKSRFYRFTDLRGGSPDWQGEGETGIPESSRRRSGRQRHLRAPPNPPNHCEEHTATQTHCLTPPLHSLGQLSALHITCFA